MKTKNKILLGVFVVGVIAIVAQALIISYFGKGRVVIIAPADKAASVRIDGVDQGTIPAAGYKRFKLKQGKHQVVVTADEPVTHEVDITTGYNQFDVPALPEQCFVQLDVTLSHYGSSKHPPLPRVVKRERHDKPWHLPKTFHLSEADLPKKVTDKVDRNGKIVSMQLVDLFETVPCEAMDQPDEELLASIGFEPM